MAEFEPITTVLPPDITLYHLLPRLPGKSVARFTRVSKQWHSFIRTHGFHKMHLHHVINNDHQNHQKLLFLPHNRPWDFQTIDCETPEDGITVSRPVPFKVRRGQEISIVASLHGMVCVGILQKYGSPFRNEYSNLILWNPMTGDYKKAGSDSDCYEIRENQFGLYYSSSEDDYKLVCLTCDRSSVYIYSLKSDSWRMVETQGWTSDHFSYRWRMDGDGDWTKVETCSLKEQSCSSYGRQHLMRNGNWLMYSSSGEHVYVLDAKKHTKRIMCSVGVAFCPVGKYMETLVSPNQYLK